MPACSHSGFLHVSIGMICQFLSTAVVTLSQGLKHRTLRRSVAVPLNLPIGALVFASSPPPHHVCLGQSANSLSLIFFLVGGRRHEFDALPGELLQAGPRPSSSQSYP